jgi:hypothetical protein
MEHSRTENGKSDSLQDPLPKKWVITKMIHSEMLSHFSFHIMPSKVSVETRWLSNLRKLPNENE